MASILWTDSDATWRLWNNKPFPGDRFMGWTPHWRPVGDSAHRISDGARTMFRLRDDYGVDFEIPFIPHRRASNLLIRVEEMGEAAWNNTNVTVAVNDVAPDGSSTADRLTATAGAVTNFYQTAVADATTMYFMAFIKKVTGATDANKFGVRNSTTATDLFFVSVDYDTRVITTTAGSGTAEILSYGRGWYRLMLTVSSGISIGNTLASYLCYTGGAETANEAALVWGAQLSPYKGPYVRSGATAVALTSPVLLADRLRRHLLNGGQCQLSTGDASDSSYSTVGLRAGADPQLVLSDRRAIESTLSLSLVNQAASPTQMAAHYSDQ